VFQSPAQPLDFLLHNKQIDEKEWRNPEGSWFRQIIPTGWQLLNLLKEIQKECNELNKDVLDYDSQDDSIEGRLTLSSKGIHFAPTSSSSIDSYFEDGRRFDSYFEDDEFDTFLTQTLQPDVTFSAWCGIGPTRCGIAPQPWCGIRGLEHLRSCYGSGSWRFLQCL
jgi:hypothetical protein